MEILNALKIAIPPVAGVGALCNERLFGLSRKRKRVSGKLKYNVKNAETKKATIIKLEIMLFLG